MPEKTDIQISGVSLNFIPIKTRVPLKFGSETLNSVTCARVQVEVNKKERGMIIALGNNVNSLLKPTVHRPIYTRTSGTTINITDGGASGNSSTTVIFD